MGKLLITGGAGFIGSTLAKITQENGWEVRILDNLSTGLKQTADALEELGIDVTIGDVRNKELVNNVMEGCDAVTYTHLRAH